MNCSRFLLRLAVSSAILLTAVATSAQKAVPKSVVSPEQSCRAYVQKFYNWYVPASFHPGNKVISEVALGRKDFVFSPELRKALKDDLEASRGNKDEVVGLDFDPFLDSQDPSRRYVVGKVSVTGQQCRAEVHGVEKGRKSAKPDVTSQLELRDGRWTFTNFLYPRQERAEDANLLSVLRILSDQRNKH